MTINKKNIFEYINGRIKDENLLSELENDFEFMLEVMNSTKNQDYYNKCSEKLINNSEFICYVIEIFENDVDFIIKITEEYLRKTNMYVDHYKIRVKLAIIHENTNGKKLKWNRSITKSLLSNLIHNNIYRKNKDSFDLNFEIIYSIFEDDYITLDYTAKILIRELFKNEYNFKLASYIHLNYPKLPDLKESEIENIILNYINYYDSYLSIYASENIFILSEVKEKFRKIKDTWNDYENEIFNDLLKIIDIFIQKSDEINITDALCYLSIKCNVNVAKKHLETYTSEEKIKLSMQKIQNFYNLAKYKELSILRKIESESAYLFNESKKEYRQKTSKATITNFPKRG